VLLAFFAGGSCIVSAAPGLTNAAPANRVLIISPSSMPIAGGTATLTIGKLRRVDGVYWGGYKIKVIPYFLKNETGKLAIVVSDESLAQVNRGKVVAIVGTATTSGAGGLSRHIDATATPADIDHGKLKLWFAAGDREMVFEPAYQFSAKETTAIPGRKIKTEIASN